MHSDFITIFCNLSFLSIFIYTFYIMIFKIISDCYFCYNLASFYFFPENATHS
jgi:uncharacterized ion transporter superfamily protein YfcC